MLFPKEKASAGRSRPARGGGLVSLSDFRRSLHRETRALTRSGSSSTVAPRSRRQRHGGNAPKNMGKAAPPAPRSGPTILGIFKKPSNARDW
jgi:hypothetical protein